MDFLAALLLSLTLLATPPSELTELNHARALRGVAPVAMQAQLQQAAQTRANQQADLGYLSHDEPERWTKTIQRTGYWPAWYAETLAYGYRTPKEMVAGFLASQPHREIVLMPRWRSVGAGFALGEDERGQAVPFWSILWGDVL